MNITLTPMRRDDTLALSLSGDILTINGEAFDFSAIPEGASLPRDAVASDWLASDVERAAGVIGLTLILPHGADAPQGTLFPQPIGAGDGAIAVPAHSNPEAAA
jgi:hypothetical protein